MKGRFLFFYFLLFLLFGILLARLLDLTVLNGARYREMADNQRVKLRKIASRRGVIFDRKGKVLVGNKPIFKKCLGQDGECLEITREEAFKLEVGGQEADLVIGAGRDYPYGEATAHLLGYLGEASEEEVSRKGSVAKEAGNSCQYKLGDLVGRMGIEEEYDCLLRGADGGELIEVNTRGQIIRQLGRREPVPGRDLYLTIEADLQRAAYEALGGKKGAVVAADPASGEILALVSSPAFDPHNLTEATLGDPDKPLFNRAIGGAYPPGSTFKIVTSAAGLEEGKITAETQIEDTGQIVIGPYRFANWYFTSHGKTEGVISLVRAIARSTDTFFYKVGEWVGAEKLVVWAARFGLGKKTGIDIPGEISGFLPNPQEGDWFLGNTYHLSIGQGALGLTPLQVNQMTSVIASGGKLCRSRVVNDTNKTNMTNKPIKNHEGCREIGLKKETIELVREGMRGACSPGGTAGVFFNFTPGVACKTGTAEFGDQKGRTHAWLTAYAPADQPEVVVTALVEAGGEGSSVAAPIVKKVLGEYFGEK